MTVNSRPCEQYQHIAQGMAQGMAQRMTVDMNASVDNGINQCLIAQIGCRSV